MCMKKMGVTTTGSVSSWTLLTVVSLFVFTTRVSALPSACKQTSNDTFISCQNARLLLFPELSSRATHVDLSYNQISRLETLKVSQAISLNMSHNEVRTVSEKAFSEMQNLVYLDLSYNALSGINITKQTFSGLKALEYLYLQGNPVSTLQEDALYFLTLINLKYVDLSDCQIARVHQKAISNMFRLETLILRGNLLTESHFEFSKGLSSIKTLDLSNNPVKRLSSNVFYPLFDLEELWLDGCAIQSIDERAFDGLESLRYLSLRNNSLDSINTIALRPLDDLVELVLSENPIKIIDGNFFLEIPDATWPIKTLRLEAMPTLQRIGENAFQYLDNLQTLVIANNRKLTTIEDDALTTRYGSLKSVNLDNNSLTTMSWKTLDWNRSKYVSLLGNRWYCDCKLRWMFSRNRVANTSSVRCQGPAELHGYDLLELSPNRLSCLNMTTKITLGVFLVIAVCILFGLSVYFLVLARRKTRYSWKDVLCLACIRSRPERYISVYQNDDLEPFARITFSDEDDKTKAAVDV